MKKLYCSLGGLGRFRRTLVRAAGALALSVVGAGARPRHEEGGDQ